MWRSNLDLRNFHGLISNMRDLKELDLRFKDHKDQILKFEQLQKYNFKHGEFWNSNIKFSKISMVDLEKIDKKARFEI